MLNVPPSYWLYILDLLDQFLFVGGGIIVTFKLLFGGAIIGIIFGTFISIMRYNNIMEKLLSMFVSVIRGTPIVLQLSFVYFVVPDIIGIKIDIISTGVLTFGLNSSAYSAEILRSGIESIDKGQFEAAKTLSIDLFHTWRDIILPQVMRNVMPSIVGEIIALLKETAIISIIGGADIMRSAQFLAASKFSYFVPICIAGVYYYMLAFLIEYCGKKVSNFYSYAKN